MSRAPSFFLKLAVFLIDAASTQAGLAAATHPALGNFSYQFDGIGRRTDMG